MSEAVEGVSDFTSAFIGVLAWFLVRPDKSLVTEEDELPVTAALTVE